MRTKNPFSWLALVSAIVLLIYAAWWFINPSVFSKYIALLLTLTVGASSLAMLRTARRQHK